jgi:hypothetical protein
MFDLLDDSHFDEDETNSMSEALVEDPFSRFNRIPIGTFWQSQKGRNRRKNMSISKAVKYSPAHEKTPLNFTLFEKLPEFLSPELVPVFDGPSEFMDFGDDSSILDSLLPPLNI